ncbi:MAG: dihydrodipicolinate synthase family protein [Eubacteriales bacterium]|jgi:4-hydroxy-tetrahydrodipicolinate synthase|nr:dihydrodipicolinate synthase family protein [Eubacteriales bacterium]
MSENKLQGVITASVTPFKADRTIDTLSMKRLVAYYQNSGLNGAFINSSSGEYFSMLQSQREESLAAAVEQRMKTADKPFWLLAGISADNLSEAIQNGRQAASLGADVAVAMPPRFYAYSDDELITFFQTIAEALPIPLLVYNHMVRLNNKLSIDCVVALSRHPNIIGVKDTHNDPIRLMTLLTRVRDNTSFSVFAGGDAVAGFSALMGGYQMNALSAIEPSLFLKLQDAGARQDVTQVMNLQQRVNELMGMHALIKRNGSSMSAFTQSLKTALKNRGLCETFTAQLGFDIMDDECKKMQQFLVDFANQAR